VTFDGWQADVQTDFAVGLYNDIWDDCRVIENDTHGNDEYVARMLDYGDVDKIIRINQLDSIHMAQRFRKPYYCKSDCIWKDPDFTLRYDRPMSNKPVEYQRLMSAHDSASSAYPRRYAFARVYNDATRGPYEMYILDVDALIAGIKSGDIPRSDEKTTEEGQVFYAYSLSDIADAGAIVHERRLAPSPNPHCNKYTISDRPNNPEDITAYTDGGESR